jgi:hypothetical protein
MTRKAVERTDPGFADALQLDLTFLRSLIHRRITRDHALARHVHRRPFLIEPSPIT